MRQLYRYAFHESVPLDDIEESMLLALCGTASLHGEAQTRLDVSHALDRDRRRCVIDGSTAAGRDFNKLFVGLLTRQYGDDAFTVQCVDEPRRGSALPRESAN